MRPIFVELELFDPSLVSVGFKEINVSTIETIETHQEHYKITLISGLTLITNKEGYRLITRE